MEEKRGKGKEKWGKKNGKVAAFNNKDTDRQTDRQLVSTLWTDGQRKILIEKLLMPPQSHLSHPSRAVPKFRVITKACFFLF